MAQGGFGQGFQILGADLETSVEEGPGLGRVDQGLGAPGARAVAYPPLHLVGGQGVVGLGGQDHPGGKFDHSRRGDHLADRALQEGQTARIEAGFQVLFGSPRPLDDADEVLQIGMGHPHLEEEPVDLGLGQRVGPLHFQGILGGQHLEGPGELGPLTPHGDGPLLHGFEEGRLGLGRRPVDLVGQDEVGEHRARFEPEAVVLGLVLDDDRGADDVGRHEVGGELNAGETEGQGLGQTPDEQGLAEAGDALEENVAFAEEGDQGQFHHGLLAHDGPGQLFSDGVQPVQRVGHGRFFTHGLTSWDNERK